MSMEVPWKSFLTWTYEPSGCYMPHLCHPPDHLQAHTPKYPELAAGQPGGFAQHHWRADHPTQDPDS